MAVIGNTGGTQAPPGLAGAPRNTAGIQQAKEQLQSKIQRESGRIGSQVQRAKEQTQSIRQQAVARASRPQQQ